MLSKQRYLIDKPIAIIGFMGAGKSSVAKLLEQHTGIRSFDSDKEIVNYSKMTVSEIINNYGEDKFRQVEAKVIVNLVENHKYIISTGGGIVESAVGRGALKNCFCVWLKVSAKNAQMRIENNFNRPLFDDIEDAEDLLNRRTELYERFSDLTVDTNTKNVSEVCKEIIDGLLKADVLHY